MLDSVFRRHWGRVVASLVGYLGDSELAEDAAQGRHHAAPVPPEGASQRGDGNQPPSQRAHLDRAAHPGAAGTRAAISIAASRLSSSNT